MSSRLVPTHCPLLRSKLGAVPVPAPPSSTFNLPTFILALVGAASGVLSTAWNVVPYVSAGAKISVKIEYIFQQTNTGLEPVFEVKASNKRRGSVEIRQWGIATYESVSARRYSTIVYLRTDTDNSDEIPKTVQGKHGAAWIAYAKKTSVYEQNRHSQVKVRGIAELGSGKLKKSKPLKLPPGALHEVPRIAT